MPKLTTPDLGGKIFSALTAFLAIGALVGTIWIATSGEYNAAAPVLFGGVTLGLAFISAAPWVARPGE